MKVWVNSTLRHPHLMPESEKYEIPEDLIAPRLTHVPSPTIHTAFPRTLIDNKAHTQGQDHHFP